MYYHLLGNFRLRYTWSVTLRSRYMRSYHTTQSIPLACTRKLSQVCYPDTVAGIPGSPAAITTFWWTRQASRASVKKCQRTQLAEDRYSSYLKQYVKTSDIIPFSHCDLLRTSPKSRSILFKSMVPKLARRHVHVYCIGTTTEQTVYNAS